MHKKEREKRFVFSTVVYIANPFTKCYDYRKNMLWRMP